MSNNEFVNRVELTGMVGHEPRVFSVGDAQVARFSLVTQRAFRGGNGELLSEVTWHDISAWSGCGVAFEDLKKGVFVSLKGRLHTTKYTGVDGTERYVTDIVAKELKLVNPEA